MMGSKARAIRQDEIRDCLAEFNPAHVSFRDEGPPGVVERGVGVGVELADGRRHAILFRDATPVGEIIAAFREWFAAHPAATS